MRLFPRSKRCALASAVAISICCLFFLAVHTQASLPAPTSAALTALSEEAPPLGEPCGAGTLLPPWTLCLFGTLAQVDDTGQTTLLDGVPLTISLGSRVVTGTTFIHPGHITPSFGLDLSPLEPGYLQPVTLTTVIAGHPVQRQVVVLPDFRTQSQRYDLRVSSVGALDPAPLWGYVISYGTGGPVADAAVTVAYGEQSITVLSAIPGSAEPPEYAITANDLAMVGAGTGSVVTLTAVYGGDVDQRVVTVTPDPQQVNFVTGWKCDGFDPLLRTGPGDGLPRVGPGDGLPNLACFWGYGRVDGVPVAGMTVTLQISGTTYAALTRAYPGEEQPRYSIAVWDAQGLSGQPLTITGAYLGYATTRAVTTGLDSHHHQRLDLGVADAGALSNYAEPLWGTVALAFANDDLWIMNPDTSVMRWNPQTNALTQFTAVNGLPAYFNDGYPATIVAGQAGLVWFVWGNAGISAYDTVGQTWQTFDTTNSGLVNDGVSTLAVSPDGSLWCGMIRDRPDHGVCHFDPSNRTWQTFTQANSGLVSDYVAAVAVGVDGTPWFGTDLGVSHYNPLDQTWETFTTANSGLVSDWVQEIAVGADASPWFLTDLGVSHYNPADQTWQTFTVTGHLIEAADETIWVGDSQTVHRYSLANGTWETFTEIYGESLSSMAIGPDGAPWLGFYNWNGVVRLDPVSGEPQDFPFPLLAGGASASAVAADGTLWFGSYDNGAVRHDPVRQTWQKFTTANSGLSSNELRAVAIGPNGVTWFGTQWAGVSRYDPAGQTWQTFTTDHGLAHNDVTAIDIDPDGVAWFGTMGGVSRYDRAASAWRTFTTTHGLAHDWVNAVLVGTDGTLWFGTANGVSHYDPLGEAWTTFTVTHGLANNNVRAVAQDTLGSLWFGTDGGVSRYDPAIQTWQTLTTSHGLISNSVYAIAAGQDGTLWFGTDAGVSHYDPLAQTWQTITWNDGLAGNWVPAIILDADESLWFGTDLGITHWGVPVPASDVAVNLDGPDTTLPGQTLAYTAHVTNQGERAASDTSLSLVLPAGVTFVNASQPPASTSPLTWSLGALAAGAGFDDLVITVLVDPSSIPGTTVTATASVTTTAREVFLANNHATISTLVRDPTRADVRTSASGPPLVVPGTAAAFDLWVDNSGGLDAANTTLTATLSPGLTFQAASPAPATVTANQVTWFWETLAAQASQAIALSLTVDSALPPDATVTLSGQISTTSPESDLTNNQASVTSTTSLTDALTLILVAPQRLAGVYGAAPVMSSLYELAGHLRVRGAVVDVQRDPAVQAAYLAWDANPGDWHLANAVAVAIKELIDQYTVSYPGVRYLVLVGDDRFIPFYRVADQNGTSWHEDSYSAYTPAGTIRAALAADRLLTDDFYADRMPAVPPSANWPDGHPLFVPDYAVGRLVERPEDIQATIAAYLANDGQIPLGPGIASGDARLAGDLQQAWCQTLAQDGLAVSCLEEPTFRSAFWSLPTGSSWAALHSNHFSLGPVTASDILARPLPFSQSLVATIGCHAGLSVPGASRQRPDLDLAEALLSQGGTLIGSTAYAYAAATGLDYSESLALALTERLVTGSAQEIGPALVHAKQAYYASHATLDSLDEKVLLPVTLYGLPMLTVTSPEEPGSPPDRAQLSPDIVMRSAPSTLSVMTYTLAGLPFTRHETTSGSYFDHAGQTTAQQNLPVQPAVTIPLSETVAAQSVHGVVLRQATYTETSSFDPVIAQSWATGLPAPQVESPITWHGWDRELPHALGHFDGLLNQVAHLNLVLGAYQADQHVERLFHGLTLEVTYSDGGDWVAPTITATLATVAGGSTRVQTQVGDETGLAAAVAICDDSQGQWQGAALTAEAGVWRGGCPFVATRVSVQVIDTSGNVTTGPWQVPSPDLVPPAGVGLEDIQAVALHWGAQAGAPGWDPWFDLDQDGDVDMVDLMQVTAAWGMMGS